MIIAVGSDEVTPLTDEALVVALREAGHEVELHGPPAGGAEEWVEASAAVARRVAEGAAERGVVCCWSGTGASIAANKVPGARAALCVDAETARMARKYNHANVLALSLALDQPADGPRDPRGVPGRAGRRRGVRRAQRRAPRPHGARTGS